MYRYGVNRNETMSCKRAYYNPMKGPVGQLGPEENLWMIAMTRGSMCVTRDDSRVNDSR